MKSKNRSYPTPENTAIEVCNFLNLGGYKYKRESVAEWLKLHHNSFDELHGFVNGKLNGALRASIDKNVPYDVENGFEE